LKKAPGLRARRFSFSFASETLALPQNVRRGGDPAIVLKVKQVAIERTLHPDVGVGSSDRVDEEFLRERLAGIEEISHRRVLVGPEEVGLSVAGEVQQPMVSPEIGRFADVMKAVVVVGRFADVLRVAWAEEMDAVELC